MYITNIRIKNFRGLEFIEFSPKAGMNIIVGPNAVGKTSVLEAIRLTKAILAPRYPDEMNQVLVSLGAAAPNMMFGGKQIDFAALAGTATNRLEVSLDIAISDNELVTLTSSELELAQALVRSSLGQERVRTQLDLIQYMSSPQGQALLNNKQEDINLYLKTLHASKNIYLAITMELLGDNIQVNSKDTNAQLVLQTLEGVCPPANALFTYFPADRALPFGEVNIQIGSADMQQQIFSHLAQPGNKYNRLKQIIVNSFVLGEKSRQDLEESFNAIFKELLPGKKLKEIEQKMTGSLRVLIKDLNSERVFDIDNMSSGEKGLILTFLLLKNGAAPHGIVLLDEPELHLNPAVCSRLVPFLNSQVIDPLKLQLFVCTHSAEILSSALHRDDCSIFHLRTSCDITPVDPCDKAELFQVLNRLGLSSMDVLAWQGTIFVEGDDDIQLLSLGFSDMLSTFQIKQLGGRSEVEKDIKRLQEAEKNGDIQRLNVFIFDHDSKPTELNNTECVRILQWDRYSIESYLLDESYLFQILNRHTDTKIDSKGSLRTLLRDLAMKQLTDEVVRRVYTPLEPENCGLRNKEITGKSFADSANLLFNRIEKTQKAVIALERDNWINNFLNQCKEIEKELREDWEKDWLKRCNAKRLFKDLQSHQKLKAPISSIKYEMMKEMKYARSGDWQIMENFLVDSIKKG